MQQQLAHVTLVVRDYDEALHFYTHRLGFQLVADTPLGAGRRWVLVAPPGLGGAPCCWFRPTALSSCATWATRPAAGYYRMTAQGVQFQETPRQEVYATVVVFADLYGNLWDLLQSKPTLTA